MIDNDEWIDTFPRMPVKNTPKTGTQQLDEAMAQNNNTVM